MIRKHTPENRIVKFTPDAGLIPWLVLLLEAAWLIGRGGQAVYVKKAPWIDKMPLKTRLRSKRGVGFFLEAIFFGMLLGTHSGLEKRI